jgi:hypothetical protein
MVELIFEKYGAPAVFLAKNAVSTNVLWLCGALKSSNSMFWTCSFKITAPYFGIE